MNVLGPRPKVSVCIVTYNHEKYIAACLHSLIEQQTDFAFEIIVGDDNSTDRTRSIVDEFVKSHPDIVKPLYVQQNRGPVTNYMETHSQARGLYVAHMDGDDVALPGKLQRQADFLDQNPDVSIVWHRMEFFNAAGLRVVHPSINFPHLDVRVGRADLALYGPFGPHSSTMYRRSNFSTRYANFPALDWLISVELMGNGCGVMLSDVLGGYRVHGAGASAGAVGNKKNRELLCCCQLEIVRRFPEFRSRIALRALLLSGLDLAARKSYFWASLKVFIACRRFPQIGSLGRLVRFYRHSKLPAEFK